MSARTKSRLRETYDAVNISRMGVTFRTFRKGSTRRVPRQILLTRREWEDLGCPYEVTVTVEAGHIADGE